MTIMPLRKCPKCGKEFKQKSHFDWHMYEKKNPCNKLSNDIVQAGAESRIFDDEIVCIYCDIVFSTKYSLQRHLQKSCKKRKILSAKDELFKLLVEKNSILETKLEEYDKKSEKRETDTNKKIKTLQSTIKKLTKYPHQQHQHIGNMTNLNVPVKLIAFGEEDMTKITDKEWRYSISRGFQSVPALLKLLRFNKKRTENCNIYISNIYKNYVMIYNGDDWIIEDRDDVIEQIVDEHKCHLIEKFDEFEKSLPKSAIFKFTTFLKHQEDNSKYNWIKHQVRNTLYNNRKLPLELRKLIKERDKLVTKVTKKIKKKPKIGGKRKKKK
jgi:hypothetical protein